MLKNNEMWIEELKIICEIMKRNNEIIRTLPERGIIVWLSDYECKNCHRKGVFYADELEYGAFYECASAKYCPNCKAVFDVIEGQNFAPYEQKRFLPIMKKKLIAALELYKESGADIKNILPVYLDGICPLCGGRTYTFVKDLGGIDYYWNYWTVCVNPSCPWPGVHREEYEPGPYYSF